MGDEAADGDFEASVFRAGLDPTVEFDGKRDIECFVFHHVNCER